MKKITIILALLISALGANAQFKSIVSNDPANDAGAMGIDVKDLSYEISADKKNITFKVETHTAVSSWDYSGFLIYIDEDLDPSAGFTPECNNKSLKADRYIMIMNMMGMWDCSLECVDTTKSGSITSLVTINKADAKTITVTIPLDKVDGNNDGRFDMIFATAVAGSTSFYVDDVPNTGVSNMDVFGIAAGIGHISGNTVSMSVYPVPASDKLVFSSKEVINGSITVYDLSGREAIRSAFNGSSAGISVSNLQNGLYFFSIAGNDGAIVNKGKFTVQH